jgi:hypothetical protein
MEVQEWWAKYLEEMPCIMPKKMNDDYWLKGHFQQMVRDEILGTFILTLINKYKIVLYFLLHLLYI